MRFFSSVILFLAAGNCFAEESWKCTDGKIRFRKWGDKKEEKISFCFESTSQSYFSASCRSKDGSKAAEKTCEADHAVAKRIENKSTTSEFGSPAFQACRNLGGEAQIVEFFDGTSWASADRCLFKDGSFVSATRLLR